MASDAAAPNVSNAIRFEENGCIAPGGLAAARPGKGQGLPSNDGFPEFTSRRKRAAADNDDVG